MLHSTLASSLVLLDTMMAMQIPCTKLWVTQGCCCCCSVAHSRLTLCDPTDHSIPSFPLLHHLLQLAQTHVHWVMITSNHLILCRPFSSCLQSFPASGFFQWVSSLHQVAKVLELQLRHQSCQWIFRVISFRKTANLDDVLYLAVTNLSVYFLFCEFPDLLKLGQESSYLYKRYLVQKSDYYRLYIEQKRKTKQL